MANTCTGHSKFKLIVNTWHIITKTCKQYAHKFKDLQLNHSCKVYESECLLTWPFSSWFVHLIAGKSGLIQCI